MFSQKLHFLLTTHLFVSKIKDFIQKFGCNILAMASRLIFPTSSKSTPKTLFFITPKLLGYDLSEKPFRNH